MRFRLRFDFYETIEKAQMAADAFNAEHPGWKMHRAEATTWEAPDGDSDKHAICWYYA